MPSACSSRRLSALVAALVLFALASFPQCAVAQVTEIPLTPPTIYDALPPFNTADQSKVGGFVVGGLAKVENDDVVLTAAPHEQGMIWHPTPVSFSSWQVYFKLSVKGSRSEGDHGLAFWYAAEPGRLGHVYGNADNFRGLGIFFDSKDDDANRNNPSVAAHFYDGSKAFHHSDDGVQDQLAGCVADYRNRGEPITARVAYKRPSKTLEVFLDMTHRGRFQRCLVYDGIDLPRGFHFGFSALTLDSDDRHVIHIIKVVGLSSNAPGDESGPLPPPTTIPATQGQQAAAPLTQPPQAAPPQQPQAVQQPPPPPTPPSQQQQQQPTQPATTYTQSVPNSQAYASAPPPPPPSPPVPGHDVDHATAIVEHTKHIADTVDAALFNTHQDTRQHISSTVQGLQNQMDASIRTQLENTIKQLRSLTESLAHSQSLHLEEKLETALRDFQKHVDTSIDAYFSNVKIAIDDVRNKHDSAASDGRNDRSKLKEQVGALSSKVDRLMADVNSFRSDVATQSQLKGFRDKLDSSLQKMEEMETKLQRAISGSGIGWLGFAVILIPAVGVLYIIKQNRSRDRFGHLP